MREAFCKFEGSGHTAQTVSVRRAAVLICAFKSSGKKVKMSQAVAWRNFFFKCFSDVFSQIEICFVNSML